MNTNTDYPKPIYYSVGYHCKNCGHDWAKEFMRGKRATDKATCPRCDCYTAEKKNVRLPFIPQYDRPLFPRPWFDNPPAGPRHYPFDIPIYKDNTSRYPIG